jgi:hypothetical protein
MCAHGAHDWQPISGWYARYRCSICRVIGRKPSVVNPHFRHSAAIEPYRCEAKRDGDRCTESAVHGWHGKRFRCAEHRHGGRTAGARREHGTAATQRPEVTSAAHEVVNAAHEVASAAHEVVNAAHEVASAAREVVTGAHEVTGAAHEVVSGAHEVSTHGPQLSSPSKGNA